MALKVRTVHRAQDSRIDDVWTNPPPGVKLIHTLRGHTRDVRYVAWSPDGRVVASPSADKTIRLWDTATGVCLRMLEGHGAAVNAVAFHPGGRTLASASDGAAVLLWDLASGSVLHTLNGHEQRVCSVVFDPTGRVLASASDDGTVKIWDADSGKLLNTIRGHGSGVNGVAFDPSGQTLASAGTDTTVRLWRTGDGSLLHTMQAHQRVVYCVAFDPLGRTLASASGDSTVRIWDRSAGRLLRTLEGHTHIVDWVGWSSDGQLLGSKSNDSTVRLWRTDAFEPAAVIAEPKCHSRWVPGLAFHPRAPLLATVGSDPDTPEPERDDTVHIWELDLPALLGQVVEPGAHYVNAKIVLVGDTGVGKSGLSLVLNGQPYRETDSTAGRHVWTFSSGSVQTGSDVVQTREALLWDLAGQPGYRVIHQLHLHEVAVALVVFDARSETDPLAGVRHWERALRLAQQRQGSATVPMKKFLVSARNDRGGISIGEERLQAILTEFGFDGYFKTSAREGWAIQELRAAIDGAIPWEELPEVSSSQLFADIKEFLLRVKGTGRLLAPASQLYHEFAQRHRKAADETADLREQFGTCIGRLENRDLIRRLTFGGYVLLQPELLDAYASALVNTAREEPDGLGSLAEEAALAGRFFVPKEQRVPDGAQEQLLLHATVEELVRHDLALREIADDGRYLVFPSQFNRDYEDAPEPPGKAVAITFDGPVQSLYSTLAVRLGHSGLFTTGRVQMWRNAAIFAAAAGGKCGLFLHEFAEARGRLILFFPDDRASAETRFHFEEFVLAHTRRRALQGTVDLVRFFVCPGCGEPVPDAYVKILRTRRKLTFACPCGGTVSLSEPRERIHFRSEIDAMERSADRRRDFDAFVVSANGETSTSSFHGWAGGPRVTLAIAFTDVVASTTLAEELRDEAMNQVRREHFAQSRRLIEQFHGREIKTIGDSFMAAFRSAADALDYARTLHANTGHPEVDIRAGIHIGPMHVEESDVFGGTVNFAARVIGAIQGAEIWLSDRAKDDIDRLGAAHHRALRWQRHDGTTMKGFPGQFTLWSLHDPPEGGTPR